MVQKPEFQFGSAFEGEEKQGLASPLDRLAAVVVDGLLLLPLVQLMQAPFKKELLKSLAFEDTAGTITWRLLNLAVLLFVFWIYNTFMIYFFSQTVGKKIFGIKVVSFRKHVSLYASSVRSLVFFAECCFLCLPFVALFTHPWRRPYHDRLSDTLVISLKKPVGYPEAQEKRRAYAFTACFIFSMGLSSIFYLYLSMTTDLNDLLTEVEQKKCEEFKENSDTSVASAIKHFAVKNIGSDCLKGVAKKALWANKDKALANLATSFAYHNQVDLSYSYLDQVCEEELDSRACRFSLWLKKNPMDNDPMQEEIDQMLVGSEVEDFYKVYFISALQAHNRHKAAQDIIAQVEDSDDMSEFLSLATFKTLLWQKKWESAYWIYKTNNIDDEVFVDFIKDANSSQRLSKGQLVGAMEQFYPGLKENISRRPAGLSPTPVEIRGLWMRIKQE